MNELGYTQPFEDRELGERFRNPRQVAAQLNGKAAVAEAFLETDTSIQYDTDGSYTMPSYGGGPRIKVY